jgi:two-component system sensor histidine kinase DegS
MPSNKETQKQFEELMVSIRYQRTRRGKKTENYLQNPHLSREIENLTRRKVERELHDGLTQTVSALAMRVNYARRLMISDPHAAEKELEKIEDLARESTREIRHMIFILRPMEMESQGLTAALEAMAGKMDTLFNQEIELIINENLVEHLTPNDQQVIYSMVEEAIDSVRKQNGARHVLVRLDRIDNQVVQLEIEDASKRAPREENPFQGQELESIQKFAGLIRGSVSVVNEGMLVRVLFPVTQTDEEGTSPLQ